MPDYQTALFAAQLSQAAYSNDGLSPFEVVHGDNRLIWFGTDPLTGFVLANDVSKTLWISFRGTDDIAGWMVDDRITLKLIPPYAGRVHAGWGNAIAELWPLLTAVIPAPLQGWLVNVTGHSLGGALAVLAGIRLQKYVGAVYTFGCPRIGDLPFVTAAESVIEHDRYQYECDIVPDMPLDLPYFSDYRQFGVVTHLAHLPNTPVFQNPADAHKIDNYIAAISLCAEAVKLFSDAALDAARGELGERKRLIRVAALSRRVGYREFTPQETADMKRYNSQIDIINKEYEERQRRGRAPLRTQLPISSIS